MAIQIKFTNNFIATLAAAISDADTAITLDAGSGAKLPNYGGGDYEYMTLGNTANNLEIVKVTARVGDILTVVRGVDGTTAKAWSAGDQINSRPCAAAMNDALQVNVAKADVDSQVFTGTPVLPTGTIAVTQAAGNSTTKIATTAFVTSAIATAETAMEAYVDAATQMRCLAWVLFDGTLNDDQNGMYDRDGTTVTVSAVGHGMEAGHLVYLDFTSGSATDGAFTVDAATDNVFTVTHTVSGDTSGNVIIKKVSVVSSGNVSSVSRTTTADGYGEGRYAINFTTPMPDVNYCATVDSQFYADAVLFGDCADYTYHQVGARTVDSLVVCTGYHGYHSSDNKAVYKNVESVRVAVFG